MGKDEHGDFGPLDHDGHAVPEVFRNLYKFELVSEPEQRKTVADAVEWHKVTHGNTDWANKQCNWIVISNKYNDFWFWDYPNPEGYEPLCTRQEFEAEVKRRGEAWTHGLPPEGIYCQVKHDDEWTNCYYIGRDDLGSFVYRVDGDYSAKSDEKCFRPTKPTITKSQAFDKLNAIPGIDLVELHERYEVVGND